MHEPEENRIVLMEKVKRLTTEDIQQVIDNLAMPSDEVNPQGRLQVIDAIELIDQNETIDFYEGLLSGIWTCTQVLNSLRTSHPVTEVLIKELSECYVGAAYAIIKVLHDSTKEKDLKEIWRNDIQLKDFPEDQFNKEAAEKDLTDLERERRNVTEKERKLMQRYEENLKNQEEQRKEDRKNCNNSSTDFDEAMRRKRNPKSE